MTYANGDPLAPPRGILDGLAAQRGVWAVLALLAWVILGMLAMVEDRQPGTDWFAWLVPPSPGIGREAHAGPLAPTVGTVSMSGWVGGAPAVPCHQYTIARAVPIGFGMPFDVLSPENAPLITGDCTEGGVSVTVGDGNQAVYRFGYVADGGVWKKITLTGDAALGGDWIMGLAHTSLPWASATHPDITMLAYTCSYLGDFIEWKCGCRHYYCEQPMWQLQTFRYGALVPQPERTAPANEPFFSRAGKVRPDGSMILLDGRILHTTNFWTRILPDSVPNDFASPVNYADGRMDVRLEVFSMAKRVPFFYEICFENGTHGKNGWGETCEADVQGSWITAPGVYTWSDRSPSRWWKNKRGFSWSGGESKRITNNFRAATGEVFLDDDLPLDVRLTIIVTPAGKPFAGFDDPVAYSE